MDLPKTLIVGLVKIGANARFCSKFFSMRFVLSRCIFLACTYPYLDIQNSTAIVEHEATISKISDDQLFYLMQRGINVEQALSLLLMVFVKMLLQCYQWNLQQKRINYYH